MIESRTYNPALALHNFRLEMRVFLHIFQCFAEYFCVALLTLKLLIVIVLQEVTV